MFVAYFRRARVALQQFLLCLLWRTGEEGDDTTMESILDPDPKTNFSMAPSILYFHFLPQQYFVAYKSCIKHLSTV